MKLIQKIREWFGAKPQKGKFDIEAEQAKERDKTASSYISCELVSFSDASYICSMAAKICIGKEVDEDYNKRLKHISRVVGRGHESTIAHSNIIMLIKFSDDAKDDFIALANAFKFLNFKTSKCENGLTAVLVGGSIRAYKYFIRECNDVNNIFCYKVISTLYISCEKEFFEDMIEDGIMDESAFTFRPLAAIDEVEEAKFDEDQKLYKETMCDVSNLTHQQIVHGKQVDIIYSDDPYKIMDKIGYYGFDMRDILKVTAFTVLFHDFSRSTSQQITRHFGAISQESQRYVDYSTSQFINPLQFNPTQYPDKDAKYNVTLFGTEKSLSLDELAPEMINVYSQLLNQGLLKQDARGMLIFNVATKVLMTFTFADGIHFIKERDSKAAQPEVHDMTVEMENILRKHVGSSSLLDLNSYENLIHLCESPRYKLKTEENDVDEIVSEEIIND